MKLKMILYCISAASLNRNIERPLKNQSEIDVLAQGELVSY